MFFRTLGALACLVWVFQACSSREQDHTVAEPSAPSASGGGNAADAPFSLPADLSGFLLFWFDDEGIHSAQSLDEIPASARKRVRVRPLDPDVEERLDPLVVYVADLSVPAQGDSRAVRSMKRSEFDALVDRASGRGQEGAVAAGPIIVYRTSWCGVCERATKWLSQNGYSYIEKDVETDAGAAQEVQRKLAAAGKSSRGVPVIDVGGKLMVGFDPDQLQRMINGG